LFYSASLFRKVDSSTVRNKIGRANRYLHWQDMQRFKSEGISTYDFGGWYQGESDQQRLSINKFKEEFGGQIVKNYICERALTSKAKIFLRVRRLLLGDAI
jgi:lipid II:glycine glycyltransferase (peptidoglycan interpeptide bridge formation enzyme)